MLYLTTRDKHDTFTAHRALQENTAPDGGCYAPISFPVYESKQLASIREKSFGQNVADILNILIERDRIDLLYKADVSLLLSMYDNNRTYFDLMFEKQRQGVDVHLEKVSFEYYCHSSEERRWFRWLLHRHKTCV